MSLESWTESLSRLPVVGLIVRAAAKSRNDFPKDMAASIAFFSFFSLFPLILGIVAVGSLFLDTGETENRLDRLLADSFPGSADFLRVNMEALIRLRGAAGVASIAGLLWSARKMFGALSRGINLALGFDKPHPSYLSPLRYFGLTLTVVVLLFLSITVPTVVDLVAGLAPEVLGEGLTKLLTLAGGRLASFVFVLAMLGAVYGLVPYERLSWREILPGALFAALSLELVKSAFVFYLENVAHLQAIYGSLSSIAVLLLWLYLSARVMLVGAELIAVARDREDEAPTST